MIHYVGLDVSVKETSICIVDESGKAVREAKAASDPGAIIAVLKSARFDYARVDLGGFGSWGDHSCVEVCEI